MDLKERIEAGFARIVAAVNAVNDRIATRVYSEELAGLKNGANPNFTFANAPENNQAAVFHNGFRLRASQYTIIGINLTLTFNPMADDNVTSDYFY